MSTLNRVPLEFGKTFEYHFTCGIPPEAHLERWKLELIRRVAAELSFMLGYTTPVKVINEEEELKLLKVYQDFLNYNPNLPRTNPFVNEITTIVSSCKVT